MGNEKTISNENEFTITRIFNAPRELVFKVFTQAEHLAHWWGPKGFQIEVHRLELRPGGKFHYSMQMPDGNRMWGIFVYHEIKPPEKIVFVNSFSDEHENVTRAPFNQNWPLEVMNTWTLIEEGGKTITTLRGVPYNATDEEKKIFIDMFPSLEQGFGGTFDQLTEYLSTLKK
jgi:uncharacterized protein YndB with AHSA1/START domain